MMDAIRNGTSVSIRTSSSMNSGVAMDAALNSLICFPNVFNMLSPFLCFCAKRVDFYNELYKIYISMQTRSRSLPHIADTKLLTHHSANECVTR